MTVMKVHKTEMNFWKFWTWMLNYYFITTNSMKKLPIDLQLSHVRVKLVYRKVFAYYSTRLIALHQFPSVSNVSASKRKTDAFHSRGEWEVVWFVKGSTTHSSANTSYKSDFQAKKALYHSVDTKRILPSVGGWADVLWHSLRCA